MIVQEGQRLWDLLRLSAAFALWAGISNDFQGAVSIQEKDRKNVD